jgi:prephenate dehydrogenase
MGAIDSAVVDLPEAVARASLVVICTPVESVPQYVELSLRHAPDAGLVTDVGSTKAGIVTEVARRLSGPDESRRHGRFVGSHPLAGSQRAGVEHAQADLFEGRTVIVTPTGLEPAEHVDAIQGFWESLGAKAIRHSPAVHDQAVAAISHLPHLAAAALAAATPAQWLSLAATGWLDTTRVASGDVEMWRQIFAANRACVLQSFDQFLQVLGHCREALERGDDRELVRWLLVGKKVHDAVGD